MLLPRRGPRVKAERPNRVTRALARAVEQDRTDRVVADLKRANVDLLRKLEAQHVAKADLVDAVYRAAREAADQVTIRPVARPPKDARKGDPETAIIPMSDWQLAKRTPTYNSQVCADRVEEQVTKVMHLTDIQRADRPIRRAVVCLGGDMVEGEQIFPGQPWRIDASLFRQTMLDGPEILANALHRLLGYYDTVQVEEVIGNHGRIGRRGDYHPETNADAMLYQATRYKLGKDPRLTWEMNYRPGESAWYKVFTIGRHGYFLFHGHQMRGGGFAGIPVYGFIRAMNAWAAGVIPEKFRFAICGHWHTMWSIPFGQTHDNLARVLWINGSTESGNEWLREELKNQTPPGQYLLFAHDRVGVTSEHRVWLGVDDKPLPGRPPLVVGTP